MESEAKIDVFQFLASESESPPKDPEKPTENEATATASDNNHASLTTATTAVSDIASVDQLGSNAVGEDKTVPSGTNVSTDRDYTVKVAVPPVLYQLEWKDGDKTKPSFYSSTPFTNLRIVQETVSAEFQAPAQTVEVKKKEKKHQPVLEVITLIRGRAARDKPKLTPPPPPSPKPVKTVDRNGDSVVVVIEEPNSKPEKPKLPEVPVPYSLDEIAISLIGYTRVVIYSQPLIKMLKSIVSYYPLERLWAVNPGNTFSMREPYKLLLHHRDDIKAFSEAGNSTYNLSKDYATQEEKDEVNQMIEHSKVLLDFVEPHYQKFIENAGDRLSKENPLVQFHELWYLFRPGTDVYFTKGEGEEEKISGGVVIGTDLDSDGDLSIKIWHLVFDGKVLKRKAWTVYILEYEGEEEITSLHTYPCKYWDVKDGGKRRKAFENRGETIFRLCQNRHKQVFYNGKLPSDGDEVFKGIVIIDNDPISNLELQDVADDETSVSRSISNTSYTRRTTVRKRGASISSVSSAPDPDDEPSLSGSESGSEAGDQVGDGEDAKEVKQKTSAFKWAKYKNLTVESKGLTKHHFLIFDPYLTGFAVLAKKWKMFDIDFISEVPKRVDMIDSVVMEATKQAIIKAISHPQNRAWKLDFIQGKGEGQIVLLHGPPGVGKTYTVECAAEATGRPLLLLTIADIGLDEKKIEEQMTKWFSLAERWEAILLIDEADIFLERRRGSDIARNGLVSVFLRKMEYFQGLLFLTTNRIGQIDDAFLSRVHVVIGYAPLDEPKRKRIWNGFFKKLEHDMAAPNRDGPKIEVSKYAKEYVLNDPEVKALSWNGREIRNAFQTAISLAGYEAAKDSKWTPEKTIDVQQEHFSSVVMMSREFHSYMDSIGEQAESDRARARMERNDEHMLGRQSV